MNKESDSHGISVMAVEHTFQLTRLTNDLQIGGVQKLRRQDEVSRWSAICLRLVT